ncbi:MAG: bifunctional response regulator/alkaline phosphatase family protein [Flavobacteriales bacterium]|nr:bifunctional response regulator/alkaline phosphatase family protein [Flavobacteriales bacterium]
MSDVQILWVDDEIDLLRAHVIFLEEKGYQVATANNGDDALTMIKEGQIDLVFLDENMPGLSGIETLEFIKNTNPDLPVVMVTKSEEENLMEDAIGAKISDYLIKPVNPKQILLSIKKHIDQTRLVSEKITSDYQQDFRNIGMTLSEKLDHSEWAEIQRKLIFWELELGTAKDEGMDEVLKMQKTEANNLFCRKVEASYVNWISGSDGDKPLMSHNVFKERVFPILEDQDTVLFFVLIDNLRFDQWKTLSPVISEHFRIDEEEIYYSILPTATQFSRNAIFAGMMPSEIEDEFPELWVNDIDEGGKNMHEEEFISQQLSRNGKDIKFSYTKIANLSKGKKMVESIPNMMNNQLNVIVYNFVDMLSHARTEMEVIKELAGDEAAYRSLTLSWFEHSPLLAGLKRIAELGNSSGKKVKMIITTDHGTIRVKDPSKLVGDRNTTTNLRYKQGKNLTYESRDVLDIGNPNDVLLPKSNLSSRYVFAKENKYFVYPNNYNYYMNFFKNTFQHGGISMEEMLIPLVTLTPR